MRIRPDIDDANLSLDAFSQDILKIEISGPDVSSFSLHDDYLHMLNVE